MPDKQEVAGILEAFIEHMHSREEKIKDKRKAFPYPEQFEGS